MNGEDIKKMREEFSMSQLKLSIALSVRAEVVSFMENGKTKITNEMRGRILSVFASQTYCDSLESIRTKRERTVLDDFNKQARLHRTGLKARPTVNRFGFGSYPPCQHLEFV